MTTIDVQLFKTVDKIKTAIELGQSDDLAADVAKLVAMTAAGIAAESAFRAYSTLNGLGRALSAWRLGKAVSGNEADIERTQVLAGFVASELVGRGIDYANDWDLGAKLFDLIHPDDDVASLFAAATIYVTPVRRDPLVLDLDGDGIETLPINTTTPLMFDLDNSGVKKSVGWIKADDGFLVLDRNGNGTIDSGAELFGDATPLSGGGTALDGFAALARLDSNLDGQITSADSAFANLRVWRDTNQDGLSQSGELFTLAALNISAINVAASSHSITVANGNRITDQGSYTRSDGSSGAAGETANSADVQLATDPFHTRFTTPLPLTPQALTLPDMNGSGQVRTLREAISSNTTLATLVTQFTQATTRTDRRALLDNILKEWSNTSTMATTFTSAGGSAYAGHTLSVTIAGVTTGSAAYQAWADKLSILEHFNGRTFNAVPTGTAPVSVTLLSGAQSLMQQSYDAIKESVYQALSMQTWMKPLLDRVQLNVTQTGVSLDYAALQTEFDTRIAAAAGAGLIDLVDFNRAAGPLVDSSGWTGWTYFVNKLTAQTMTPALAATLAGVGVLLKGQAGYLANGSSADDVIVGDGGNDTLDGGLGDDAYVFKAGDGNDSIYGNGGNTIFYVANDAVFMMRRMG